MTLPSTSATIARTDAGQTFTGTQVLTATIGSSSTATTQTKNDNSTKVATTAYVDTTLTAFASGTNATLTGPQQIYYCTGGNCTLTMPVPVAGYQFCIFQGDNQTRTITLAALGSSAMYENTARTAFGTAGTGTLTNSGSAAAKDSICVVGIDSTHYITTNSQGTWVAN